MKPACKPARNSGHIFSLIPVLLLPMLTRLALRAAVPSENENESDAALPEETDADQIGRAHV